MGRQSARSVGDAVVLGFRTLARRYWRTGLGEVRGDLSKHTFVEALQRLVPSMRAEYLAGTHAGVRAQALSSDGRLLDDFWFDRADRVLHLRNAPRRRPRRVWRSPEEVVGAAEEFSRTGDGRRGPLPRRRRACPALRARRAGSSARCGLRSAALLRRFSLRSG